MGLRRRKGWGIRATSVGVFYSVVHDGQKGQPCLLRRGDDLGGRQQETSEPSVPQLKSERILDALAVGPVNSAPTGLIWDRSKDRAEGEG